MNRDKVRESAQWFARNVLPHEPAIRAWLRRLRVYDLDIDDIIQEMYARIVSQDSLDTIVHPKRYAFQTANSIVIDHVRRTRIVSIFSVGNLEEFDLAAPDADPEQRATIKDELAEIAGALADMPATTRDILMLRRVEGLSQRETAQRLSISEKTVEKHVARGTLLLRNRFGRGGNPSGRRRRTADGSAKRHYWNAGFLISCTR